MLTLPTLESALHILDSYNLPTTATAAVSYLESVCSQSMLMHLYRHFFPQEYAASTASHRRHWTNEAGVKIYASPIEIEFLEHVDQQLFPLTIFSWDEDFLMDASYLDHIPLAMFGYPDEGQTELDDWAESYQIFIFLGMDLIEDYLDLVAESDGLKFAVAATSGITRHDISWPKFEALCAVAGEPICWFPHALNQPIQNTGNLFLDCPGVGYMNPNDIQWTVAAIEYWSQEWRQAEPILKGIRALSDWLDEDLTRFVRIAQLWKQACPKHPSRKSHPA